MSFFKKLFGGSDENSKNPKFDINKILSMEDTNSAIIELDTHISELCEYGDDLEKLSTPQRFFFFNQNLEREINNGGFNQYFFNTAGNFALETLASLHAIKARKTATILQAAIDQFPEGKVPSDREDRQDILENIEGTANPIWEGLNQKFYAYEDDLNQLNLDYVKSNIQDF